VLLDVVSSLFFVAKIHKAWLRKSHKQFNGFYLERNSISKSYIWITKKKKMT